MKEIVLKVTNSKEAQLAKAELVKACRRCDLNILDEMRMTTAAMEIIRNAYYHGKEGKVTIVELDHGVEVVVEDKGPGIEDVDQVMLETFSTTEGPGLGLPSAKSIVDEFEITSKIGIGTKVTLRKFRS